MKKLTTLVFAFFLTAGMAFGQNSATTTQSGDNNKSQLVQNGGNNEATIFQDGDDNEFGTAPYFDEANQVYQSSSGGDKNSIDVKQVGNNNTIGANYYLQQVGSGNNLDIDQYGSGNKVRSIGQGNNNNPSVNGKMVIQQGEEDSPNNYNFVSTAGQFGIGNELFVTQKGGNSNKAYVRKQKSTGAEGNKITINQIGESSSVGLTALNSSSLQYGASQSGNKNKMTINQDGADKAGSQQLMNSSFSNEIFATDASQSLVQVGEGNSLTIDQNSGANTVEAVYQEGTTNAATINQSNGNNTAGVYQNGMGNKSTITQN